MLSIWEEFATTAGTAPAALHGQLQRSEKFDSGEQAFVPMDTDGDQVPLAA